MDIITNVLEISLVFIVALVAATVIERLLEFIAIIMDFIEPYIKLDRLWYKLGLVIQKKYTAILESAKKKNKEEFLMALKALRSVLFRENAQPGLPAIIRLDLLRKAVIRIFMVLLGVIFGILLCGLAMLDVFQMINELEVISLNVNSTLAIILSGILIGAGTSPVHSIIKYAENKKESQKRQAEIARLKASLKTTK
ncbi:hypothetical protein JXJ21_06810 [candidate division KSB1 bacterium]|nr:hypothetical protein [candidate division KSB1 bacterium]